MTLRERMEIICLEALGKEHYKAVALPEAIKRTALMFFQTNKSGMKADLVRSALHKLDVDGVL